MKTAIYSFFLFLLPLCVSANVIINEIAWMGTANSPSDEWIELYSTDGIDLTDWHLVAEDGAMDITLSGSVGAGGYFLIERTDDTTVPNMPADVVTPFGSGLSNSGEILVLRNTEGIVIDRVDASAGWPAGDNTTKETMQRSGNIWITALATPKVANVSAGSNDSSENDSKTDPSNSSSPNTNNNSQAGGADEPYVQPENLPRIKAGAGEDQRAAVGEQVQFRGNAWGLDDLFLENARYAWNFGDGATYEGQNVGHEYMFPGTYTVRLVVSSGKYSAFDDVRVVVEDNTIQVSEVLPGDVGWIELQNKGLESIHVGGWIAEIEDARFIIPLGTTIAPQSFTVLSAATTHLFLKKEGDHAYLFYPNGTYASGLRYVLVVPQGTSVSDNSGLSVFTEPTPGKSNIIQEVATSPVASKGFVQPSIVSAPPQKTLTDAEDLPLGEKIEEPTKKDVSFQPANLADAPTFSKTYREALWFGGSLILGGLAAVGVVLFRRRRTD